MGKDDATWLNGAYVLFLLLIAYVVFKAAELAGVQTGWGERYEWFNYAAKAVALVGGVAATWSLRQDAERHDYFLAAIGELRKVTWPSWPDTKRMTVVVCVVVGIFAVIVGVFDLVWAKALKVLLT